jgi:hypothetical protein
MIAIQRAIRLLYPALREVGHAILRKLFEQGIQLALNRIVGPSESFLLEGSIYADPSVLEQHVDGKGDRWTHVFTEKYGHLNPSNPTAKGILALIYKSIPILGQEIPLLDEKERQFKKRFELGFTDANLLFWVRTALNKTTGNYYIESAGAGELKKMLNNGDELLALLK